MYIGHVLFEIYRHYCCGLNNRKEHRDQDDKGWRRMCRFRHPITWPGENFARERIQIYNRFYYLWKQTKVETCSASKKMKFKHSRRRYSFSVAHFRGVTSVMIVFRDNEVAYGESRTRDSAIRIALFDLTFTHSILKSDRTIDLGLDKPMQNHMTRSTSVFATDFKFDWLLIL